MYSKYLMLMTVIQVISGAVITDKRKATFNKSELKEICKSIRGDLNSGVNPDQTIDHVVHQYGSKLNGEDDSRLTKFRGLVHSFEKIVQSIEKDRSRSIFKQSDEFSNEPEKFDDVNTELPATVSDGADEIDQITDNQVDDDFPDYGFHDHEYDQYDVCDIIIYPDYVDLDEIDESDIYYGYDYDNYYYEYSFEPFGLRLNLRLSVSAN